MYAFNGKSLSTTERIHISMKIKNYVHMARVNFKCDQQQNNTVVFT